MRGRFSPPPQDETIMDTPKSLLQHIKSSDTANAFHLISAPIPDPSKRKGVDKEMRLTNEISRGHRLRRETD